MNTTPASPNAVNPGRRRRFRPGWAILLILAAAAGTVGLNSYRSGVRSETPEFETAVVVRGDLEKTVTALGSVQPKDYVDVGVQVSGQLKKVHVDIGDVVKEGDLLAEIDPTVYESRVRADRAGLADLKAQLVEQQAQLVLARQQDKRNRDLLASRAASEDAVQQTTASVKVAEARIVSLQAQIDESQSTLDGDLANLGYTKIYAPMSGTVVSQTTLEGQTVNSSQTAPTIVRIADLETMTVQADVAEADVPKLEVGMPVYFTTLGMPERRWTSTVRQILPTPEIVNDVVLFHVLIDVTNTGSLLMTDMTTQVFFVLGRAEGIALAPMAALKPGPDGDGYSARVLSANGVEERRIEIGLSNRTTAEVKSGLAVGERVITGTKTAVAEEEGPRPLGFPMPRSRR